MVGMQSGLQLEIQADIVGQSFVLLLIALEAIEDFGGGKRRESKVSERENFTKYIYRSIGLHIYFFY